MNVGNYVTAGLWYHRFKGSSSFLPHKQIITTATILAQILTPQSKYVSVLGGVLTQNLNVQICGGNDTELHGNTQRRQLLNTRVEHNGCQ